jgi:membrane fusion protein, heavy metal efflux system
MRWRGSSLVKNGVLTLCVLVVVSIAAAAWHRGALPIGDWLSKLKADSGSVYNSEHVHAAQLVGDRTDRLALPADVASKSIGIQIKPARKATETRKLELAGSLALDPARLVRVHSRFSGEVIEIAPISVSEPGKATYQRPLRLNDRVEKGQVLAVVWNTDLGNKKNELVDALSQWYLDQDILERQEKLLEKGAISDAQFVTARRNVEMDVIKIEALKRTLHGLRVTQEEITAVEKEAERIHKHKDKTGASKSAGKDDVSRADRYWARVEVFAPMSGVIVEKNFVLGEIVDTSTNLFQIADIDKLAVIAHVYEEDLRALQSLTPDQRKWTVHLQAAPDVKLPQSRIEVISPIVDPNQHTALVMGEIDNPGHQFLSTQFVTATVELPPLEDEVVVPATAVIEDGHQSIVFVELDPKSLPEADPKKSYFEQRRVRVTRREQKHIFISSRLTAADKQRGLQVLEPGEAVVQEGAVILEATLEDLRADNRTKS